MEQKVEELLKQFGGTIRQALTSHSFWMVAGLSFLMPFSELVVVAGLNEQENRQVLEQIQELYLPNMIVVYKEKGIWPEVMQDDIKMKESVDGKVTLYLCQDYSCHAACTSVDEILQQLKK